MIGLDGTRLARSATRQSLTRGPGVGGRGRGRLRQTWRRDVDADGTERMTRGWLERERGRGRRPRQGRLEVCSLTADVSVGIAGERQ